MAAEEGWVLPDDFQADKELGTNIVLHQDLQDARQTVDRLTNELREEKEKKSALLEKFRGVEEMVEQQGKLNARAAELRNFEKELEESLATLQEQKDELAVRQKQFQSQTEQDRAGSETFQTELQTKRVQVDEVGKELASLNDRRNRLLSAVTELEMKQSRKKKELAKYNPWFWVSVLSVLLLAISGSVVWQHTQDLQLQLDECRGLKALRAS